VGDQVDRLTGGGAGGGGWVRRLAGLGGRGGQEQGAKQADEGQARGGEAAA